MKQLGEEYTAGVLKGIPIFCVNRVFSSTVSRSILKANHYTFKFDNGYGASVVEFEDKEFTGGHKFELAVLKYHGGDSNITYETDITTDVERGDEYYMHELLYKIEALSGDWDLDTINSVDN